jgi:hypothetical protein
MFPELGDRILLMVWQRTGEADLEAVTTLCAVYD